jgi:hypothetical protein
VLELVGRVYDAALDERLWTVLAPQIAATFESSSTALLLQALAGTSGGKWDKLLISMIYGSGL